MTTTTAKPQTVMRFVYSDAVVRALGGTYRWSLNGETPLADHSPAAAAAAGNNGHNSHNAKTKKAAGVDGDILVDCEIANLARIYSELLEYNAELSHMSRQRSASPNKRGKTKKDGKGQGGQGGPGGQGKVAGKAGKEGDRGRVDKNGKKNGGQARRKAVSSDHVNLG